MADSLKQIAIKGVSWSFLEQILARGVNFVVGIVLARLLTPTDYGLVGMLGFFISISQLFIDGGLTHALVRTKDPSEEDYSTVYIINMVLSFIFYALLFFCAPYVADFYQQPLLKSLMRAIALTLIISSFSSVPGTLLTKKVDFRAKSFVSIISSVLSGMIGIICAYKGMGVWALVAQTLSSTLLVTILTILFAKWFPKLVFSIQSFSKLFAYSSKLLLASIISVIYDNAYPMVIGKRFTAALVGEYSRAVQFPAIANSTIVGALNRVAFPVLSEIQDDNERLLSVYEKYIQLTCFIIFPVLLWLCGAARPLVSFLLTDKWISCVPLMQILCFSFLTGSITTINLNLLYVKGRSDLVLRLEIIKKTIAFAILFGSMSFGIRGMCIGQVIYSFIAMYLNSYYTNKILGYGFWRQMKAVAPYFFLSLIVVGLSLLVSAYIPNSFASIVVSFIASGMVYFFIAQKANLFAYREAKDLITERFPKIGRIL